MFIRVTFRIFENNVSTQLHMGRLLTSWKEPEGTVLSDISQKEKYQMISFICGVWRDKTNEQTKQN